MKRLAVLILVLVVSRYGYSQKKTDAIISSQEVERIEKALASDDMQGRRAGTPGAEKAASFIAGEFKKAGLKTWSDSSGYLQSFIMLKPKPIASSGNLDGVVIDQSKVIAYTSKPTVKIDENAGYEIVEVKATDAFQPLSSLQSKSNLLVIVNTAHAPTFAKLSKYKPETSPTERTVFFVLADKKPSKYTLEAVHEFTTIPMSNVIGVVPGKSKKDEYVIFSAHYDHLGIEKPNAEMDSIFNGANDDASGTTAVILLANYFKKMNTNERTLLFVAFTGEESGLLGSEYFGRFVDASKAIAMFNIEMIGTHSKWGANSAFITGYERTDMGKILEKNLSGSQFKFYPDPYVQYNLFYRSDNASMARQGVPAHTISTSKMDVEKFYHTQDDEFETLDLKNMTEIIKAIALSSTSIVTGKDTPTRVDASQLK